jgi:tRNA (guanine37-N1)-methyltransferase
MPFNATVLTLYPDMFPGPLGLSMAGRGLDGWRVVTGRTRHQGLGN